MPVTTRRQSTANALPNNTSRRNNTRLQGTETSTDSHEHEEQDDIDVPFRKSFTNVFYPNDANNTEDDSDYRNSSRKRLRKPASKAKRRDLQRIAADVSDNENVKDDNSECPLSNLFRTKAMPIPTPAAFQRQALQFDIKTDTQQLATLNLMLCNLPLHSDVSNITSDVKVVFADNVPHVYQCQHSHSVEPFRAGFLSLPWEIRVRIYRQLLVSDDLIVFHRRSGFSRTSSLLRTCKQVAAEGASILYAENTFHFERSSERRGNYFDRDWPEIGFKDIRRFFHAIGNTNIAYLKSVSFRFTDCDRRGAPSDTINDIVRFVDDPILHDVLSMLASMSVLDEFGVMFHGESVINTQSYYFLKMLTGIRCRRLLHNEGRFAKRTPTIGRTLVDKLKALMVLEEHDLATEYVEKQKSKIEKFHSAYPNHF